MIYDLRLMIEVAEGTGAPASCRRLAQKSKKRAGKMPALPMQAGFSQPS